MKKIFSIVCIAACFIQTGCTTTSVWTSQEEVALKTPDANAIAEDIVSAISYEYPPAKTVFQLSSQDEGTFGIALESVLRDWGFAIDTTENHDKESVTKIAYTIDDIDGESTYWVGIRVEPEYRLDRLYVKNESDHLMPNGGFTVRGSEDRSDQENAHVMPHINRLSQAWSVQVYASSDMEDVQHHQSRLRQLGYSSHIVNVGSTGKMKAIRLGPFRTASQAKVVRKTMRSILFKDAYLVAPAKSSAS